MALTHFITKLTDLAHLDSINPDELEVEHVIPMKWSGGSLNRDLYQSATIALDFNPEGEPVLAIRC